VVCPGAVDCGGGSERRRRPHRRAGSCRGWRQGRLGPCR
jgi:hypothetical protein